MRIFSMLFATLLLSACAPRLMPAPIPIATGGISETATPREDPKAQKIASLAINDLSVRLDLDPSSVQLLAVESILWENTALGCPLPGRAYVQQPVSGYRLRLEANGLVYVYHTDTDITVILCPEEDLPSFPVTPGEIDDGQPWMPVD